MKNDTWRLDPAAYPWRTRLTLRTADIDTERHINNVAVIGLHAEARLRYQQERFPGTPPWYADARTLRARQVVTSFLAVTHYPDDVEVGLRVLHTDSHSSVWATGLFQQGRCVGTQEVEICAWEGGEPRPFTAAEMLKLSPPVHPDPDGVEAADAKGSVALDDGSGSVRRGPIRPLPVQDIVRPWARTDYPTGLLMRTRYSDHDAHWCLSEPAVMRYVEHARAEASFRLIRDSGVPYGRAGGVAVLLANKRVRMLNLCPHPPATLQMRIGIGRLGRTSLDLAIGLFDGDRQLVGADGVVVFVDAVTQRPTPVPDKVRAALKRLDQLELD